MKKHQNKAILAITTSIIGAYSTQAYELNLGTNLPPIDVHGFASQGFLVSSDYNYLANDTKNGSFQFSEFGLNMAMNPFPNTRIAVQGFDFDTGNVGQYDPFLDYALIEYTVCDELGARAGRIRRPAGIYNSIQDIDLARTYVLLPQGMYDARWRDWSAGLDGGELFGSVSLQKAGSISYEAYAGLVNMASNGGVARYVENGYPTATFHDIDSTPVFGGQLWYNTPLDGLRLGGSMFYMEDFGFGLSQNTGLGPVDFHTVGNVLGQQYSAEYVWKNWTFQAEYSTYDLTGYTHPSSASVPLSTLLTFIPVSTLSDNPNTWYVAVSHRFNKHVEVGTYYTQFQDGSAMQKDATLSLRLDIKDWWILKVEGHYIEGTALLRDQANNPNDTGNNNSGWFMLAVKTTVSF